jgi:hypothetical protein
MSEKEISLGRLFVQEAIKAGTWGFIFLLIMGMFITSIKQDIKEGIAYGVDRFVTQVVIYAMNPYLVGKTKQLVKKGIEFSLNKAAEQARIVIHEKPAAIEKTAIDKDKTGQKKAN